MQIVTITPASPYLAAVKALGRAESRWLGFLPNGAFDQAAHEGRIAGAVDNDQLLGYVLYRISQGRVMITHLAVPSASRRRGVARALITHLSQSYPMCSGVGLSCRRDFPAHAYWSKVGFVAIGDRQGRSREGKPLTFWWQDHGHPGLFSQTANAAQTSGLVAAIDANVFFDLVGEPRPQGEESLALQDDWMQGEAKLCVTDEIQNDIDRGRDKARRKHFREKLTGFECVSPGRIKVDAKRVLLRGLFPENLDPHTTSDLEHVSRTAAEEISYFITRDEGLLSRGSGIAEAVGVVVLSPTDFINQVDRLRREGSYRPIRLAGGVVKLGLLRSDEIEEVTRAFGGKNSASVRKQLRALLLQLAVTCCQVARGENGAVLALLAHSTNEKSLVRDVSVFWVRSGVTAETVARFLLHRLILEAAHDGCKLVRLDEAVEDSVIRRAALEEYGFIPGSGKTALVKYCRRTVCSAAELVTDLESLMETAPEYFGAFKGAVEALRLPTPVSTPASAGALESTLWPAKLSDASLPSFVIPIKPGWAAQLFDEDLASQFLIAVGAKRLMAREGVYYRSPNRAGLAAPARLLWYVSKHPDFPGSGCVRACSMIAGIEIGPATKVYGYFRRLGVYRWDDVAEITAGDKDADIMAVRLVNTEPFLRPVAWNQLAAYGVRGSIQGPTRITADTFARLYRSGMSL